MTAVRGLVWVTVVCAALLAMACAGSSDGGTPSPTPRASGGGVVLDKGEPTAEPTNPPFDFQDPNPDLLPSHISPLMEYTPFRSQLADYMTRSPGPIATLTVRMHSDVPRVRVEFTNRERDLIVDGYMYRDIAAPCMGDNYPDPCVYVAIVNRGAEFTLYAGDSRAGFWPSLESTNGPGCSYSGVPPQEKVCTSSLTENREIDVYYYGGESPGLLHYTYPTCPTRRAGPPGGPRLPKFEPRCVNAATEYLP
jgi:hypothetical protein